MTIAAVLVFLFYAPILAVLSSPLKEPLFYSTPAGSFSFVMRICLTGSLIITIPVLTYNIIMFIRPAFKQSLSIKQVLKTTISSTLLAITGALFAFYYILPETLKFFSDFQVSGLKALISADSYLSFITNLIIMFVIVFQIPLVIMFIDHIRPIKPMTLLKKGKWVILGSLIIAILQPFTYDIVTSILIAMPMIVLYYASIVVVIIQHARIKKAANNLVHATVVKPAKTSVSDLSLNEALYDTLIDELADLEAPKPISVPTAPIVRSAMDIKKPTVRTEVAVPAWVLEKKAKQQQFSKRVNVFSDIIRKPNHSRILAS
jgi:sec-independent protein translocase protein TatC